MKGILFIASFCLLLTNYSQQVKTGSPIIGTWQLISPKKSPGPEFVPETYIGVSVFQIAAGSNISVAAASYDHTKKQYVNAAEFIAEWDEKILSGIISVSNWPKVTDPLKINVPMEYNPQKDQVIVHINNPEYGDVKFIYKRVSR